MHGDHLILMKIQKVSFNARDELGDKIDKVTVMMSRLAAKDSKRKHPSNPKYIKEEVLTPRVRIGPIVKEVIRIEVVGQTVETEDNMEIIGLDTTIDTTIFKRSLEDMEDKTVEENIVLNDALVILVSISL